MTNHFEREKGAHFFVNKQGMKLESQVDTFFEALNELSRLVKESGR